MKKKIWTGILSLISIGVWIGVFCLHYTENYLATYYVVPIQRLAYMLSFLCYWLAFSIIWEKIRAKWGQILFATGTGILFTIQCVLCRSYGHYLEWRRFLGEEVVLFHWQLKSDIRLCLEEGPFQYVLCFVVMAVACGLLAYKVDKFLLKRARKLLGIILKRFFLEKDMYMEEMGTERLFLRFPIEDDIPAFAKFYSTQDIVDQMDCYRSTEYAKEYAEEDIKEWVKECDYGFGKQLVIQKKEDEEVIGLIQFDEYKYENHSLKLSFFLGEEYRNHGYMKETLTRVLEYSFDELELHKVTACAFAENESAKAFLLKNGFSHEGTLKDDCYKILWYCDVDYFGCIAPGWEKN